MQAKPCGRNQKIFKAYKDKSKSWEGDLTKKDLYDSLKRMQKDKSPSNNDFKK